MSGTANSEVLYRLVVQLKTGEVVHDFHTYGPFMYESTDITAYMLDLWARLLKQNAQDLAADIDSAARDYLEASSSRPEGCSGAAESC